jgi:hypothetical protein
MSIKNFILFIGIITAALSLYIGSYSFHSHKEDRSYTTKLHQTIKLCHFNESWFYFPYYHSLSIFNESYYLLSKKLYEEHPDYREFITWARKNLIISGNDDLSIPQVDFLNLQKTDCKANVYLYLYLSYLMLERGFLCGGVKDFSPVFCIATRDGRVYNCSRNPSPSKNHLVIKLQLNDNTTYLLDLTAQENSKYSRNLNS